MDKVCGHSALWEAEFSLQRVTKAADSAQTAIALSSEDRLMLFSYKSGALRHLSDLRGSVNNKSLFSREEFRVQDGDGAALWSSRTVQTAHANRRSHRALSCGRAGEAGGRVAALNMGKFGEWGRRVKKSQQESSLDDRRNLISKIHKSSSEDRRIMGTMGASVRVNTY